MLTSFNLIRAEQLQASSSFLRELLGIPQCSWTLTPEGPEVSEVSQIQQLGLLSKMLCV